MDKACEHGIRHPHPCDHCLNRDIPPGKRLADHPCYGLPLDPTGFAHRNSWPLSAADHPYCARCGTEIEGPNNRQKEGAPLHWEPRSTPPALPPQAARIAELEAQVAWLRSQLGSTYEVQRYAGDGQWAAVVAKFPALDLHARRNAEKLFEVAKGEEPDVSFRLGRFETTVFSAAVRRDRTDDLAAQAKVVERDIHRRRTLTDCQRMLWRDDVEGICQSPDLCFGDGVERARCGPCAIKQATACGVETDLAAPNLPAVTRARRENGRLNDRLTDAYAALRSIAEGNLGDGPGQASYDTIRIAARGALPEDMRR